MSKRNLTPLMKKYEKSTEKKAKWGGKLTKGYKKWRRSRSKRKKDSNMKGEVGIDITKKLENLSEIFPQAFSDGEFDCCKLKQILGESEVSDSEEKYNFTWAGKSKCLDKIKQSTNKTLKPDKEESLNFDRSENLFIEGENLETLKILQKSYYNEIDMIYIDPPYNTGKDRVYKDNYTEDKKNYEKRTGQRDEKGKLVSNPETDGRYHSKWLNMMYPRLFLARNLLSEEGVIFVSIDDNEVHNLRLIMDEIFGEENFITQFCWMKTATPPSLSKKLRKKMEWILLYQKSPELEELNSEIVTGGDMPLLNEVNEVTEITFPKGSVLTNLEDGEYEVGERSRVILHDDVKVKNGKIVNDFTLEGPFKWTQETVKEEIGSGTKFIVKTNTFAIRYIRDEKRGKTPSNLITKQEWSVETNEKGRKELENLFGESVYNYPKPTSLLRFLCKTGTTLRKPETSEENQEIILDFFAGSSTTAHATLTQNAEDGGNRNFIMVQLPEETEDDSIAKKEGFDTIADIAKERIRRVIERDDLDEGFKAFRLTDSNIREWNDPSDIEEFEEQMELQVDPLKPESSDEDVIYEILLKEGFTLNAEIEELNIKEKTVFRVTEDGKEMFLSLEDEVSPKVVEELVGPESTFVCFDSALTDSAKDNIARLCDLKTI